MDFKTKRSMPIGDLNRPASVMENPNFRKWFGGSKVVDHQGNPLVVYHGTKMEFNVFDAARLGENFGSDTSMQGFFFTPEAWVADSVADSIEGPCRSITMNVFLSIKNPIVIDAGRGMCPEMANLINEAKIKGHDGVIIKNWDDGLVPLEDFDGSATHIPDQYVVFQSTQIKSATANDGAFDPGNPDITK